MTVIRAAAVQLSPVLYSREGTVERVIADLDFSWIHTRKILMDSSGHYSRPELLSLMVDRTPRPHLHDRAEHAADALPERADDVRV
jgi:aliphatic nitrilase